MKEHEIAVASTQTDAPGPHAKLAWHAPRLERAQVSFDTGMENGSLPDGTTGTDAN